MKQKTTLTFVLLSLLFSLNAQVKTLEEVKITKEPTSIEEFLALRGKIAKTPQGGASMFILALHLYSKNQELGKKCITVMIDKSRLSAGNWYKSYQPALSDKGRLVEQMKRYSFLPKSYFQGSSPENAYKTKLPYILKSQINPYSGDLGNKKYKLFVFCSGASSPRPITLRQNDKGIWKAQEWSSILMGIQKPKVEEDDDL